MSNFDKHDGQSSFKSAIIIPFGFVLFLCWDGAYRRIKASLVNTGFVLRNK
jgi:hypothetical protein